jgi:hypothetical protein
MLYEVMRHLYGTMVYKWPVKELYGGEFKIENGSISLPFLLDGQYFRIVGSVLNDGVYKYPATDLTDETFHGAIWALAVDPALVELSEEIAEWQKQNKKAVESPFQSESFGGYSYTVKNSGNGESYSWKKAFASRLNQWRKI